MLVHCLLIFVTQIRVKRGKLTIAGYWQLLYEPRHDKTNKVTVRLAKTQISLCIRPVWSESSLGASWVTKDPNFLHANSEDSDQIGRLSLCWGHSHFVGFVMSRLTCSLGVAQSTCTQCWRCLLGKPFAVANVFWLLTCTDYYINKCMFDRVFVCSEKIWQYWHLRMQISIPLTITVNGWSTLI